MADKNKEKGMGADVMQEESLDHEETATADAWDEELPPEDGFHDPAEEAVETEVEEGGHEDALAAARAEAQKRGRNVFFGIMGVGAIAIATLVYVQFGSAPPAGSAGVIPMAAVLDLRDVQKAGPAPKQPEPAKAQVYAPESEELKTKRVDMVSLYQGSKEGENQGQVAIPTPSNDKLVDKKPEDATTAPIMTANAVLAPAPTTGPQKIEEAPVLPSPVEEPKVVKIENIPVSSEKPQTAATPEKTEKAPFLPKDVSAKVDQASPPSMLPVNDPRQKEMEGLIASLKKALDEAQAQNAQLTSRLESLSKTPSPSSAEAALKTRVAELEKKLAEKDKTTPVKEKKQDLVLNDAANSESASITVTEKAKPVPTQTEKSVKSPAKPKAKKAPAPVKKKAVAKTEASPKAPVKSTEWVLRAATPEAAWVSQGKNAVELRRLAVGETVPGLGKIKEIRQSGDAWQVVTDKGIVQ